MNLDKFLRDLAIDAPRHEHAAVMTCEEADRLVPPLPGTKTKNLFLRDKKGSRHLLVSVPPELAVDLNALGVALGAGRLGFGSAERLANRLGIEPGAVSLLALANDRAHAVEFVIDRALWAADASSAPFAQYCDDTPESRRSRAIPGGDGTVPRTSTCPRFMVAATGT